MTQNREITAFGLFKWNEKRGNSEFFRILNYGQRDHVFSVLAPPLACGLSAMPMVTDTGHEDCWVGVNVYY